MWFDGEDVSRIKAHKRVIDGLIQAPEGRGVFPGMTVIENLEMGCYGRKFDTKAEHDERLDWVFETFPRLAERRNQVGGTLSGGEQQMLAIGRALMARPKVLLLDEPSMGLAPMVISQIFKIISEINKQGTTVLLVEQNAQQALSRSDRAYILETGTVTRTGVGPRPVGRRQHPRRLPRRGVTDPNHCPSPEFGGPVRRRHGRVSMTVSAPFASRSDGSTRAGYRATMTDEPWPNRPWFAVTPTVAFST